MNSYDAIVVGSGACGGWAAMELTQAGMQVLMLEAGARGRSGAGLPSHLSLPDGLSRPRQAGSAAPLLRQRAQLPDHDRQRRESLHDVARYDVPVGTLALSRRPHAALGARDRSHGRLRVQGGLARRLRHGLGGLLCRHEAVLRPRRELHRRQRRRWKACRSFPTACSCRPCRSIAPRRSSRRHARASAGRRRTGAWRS